MTPGPRPVSFSEEFDMSPEESELDGMLEMTTPSDSKIFAKDIVHDTAEIMLRHKILRDLM